MRNNNQRRQTSNVSPVIIGLLLQLYRTLEQSEYKPPVTIAFLAMNIVTHVHPTPYVLGYSLTDIRGNCLHPLKILQSYSYYHIIPWHRFLLSAITHADDMHLYYNMLSLCWKGLHLEKMLGSIRFFFLIVFSMLAAPCFHLLLSYLLYQIIGLDAYTAGFDVCAVGFSAVLFSLKYVWNILSPEMTQLMGFSVPSRYAAWLELVLISLVTPNASFIGHLAGILAGYSYLLLFTGHGPFSALPLPASYTHSWQQTFSRFTGWQARPRYTYYSGPLHGGNNDYNNSNNSNSNRRATNNASTYENHFHSSYATHNQQEEVVEIPLDDDEDIELEFVEDLNSPKNSNNNPQHLYHQRSGMHSYDSSRLPNNNNTATAAAAPHYSGNINYNNNYDNSRSHTYNSGVSSNMYTPSADELRRRREAHYTK